METSNHTEKYKEESKVYLKTHYKELNHCLRFDISQCEFYLLELSNSSLVCCSTH